MNPDHPATGQLTSNPGSADGGSFAEVSSVLWKERQLLELLEFKLEEEHLVVAAGRTRWLAHATREVDLVLDRLAETELSRAVAVDALGHELGLGPSPSLRALVAALPTPWDEIFEKHRGALLETTESVRSLADGNRQLLGRRRDMTADALRWLTATGADGGSYTARGTAGTGRAAHHLVNEAL